MMVTRVVSKIGRPIIATGIEQHEEDVRGHLARADEGDTAQREAEEHAARIAHEDARRIEVVDEETQRARRRRPGTARRRPTLPTPTAECEQEAGRDDRRAGRQAVHVVEQIEGVGDADNPQDRQRNGDRGERLGADLRTAHDQRARCQDLRDQLGMRPQVPPIVDQPRDKQQRATNEQAEQARVVLRKSDNNNGGGDINGNAA